MLICGCIYVCNKDVVFNLIFHRLWIITWASMVMCLKRFIARVEMREQKMNNYIKSVCDFVVCKRLLHRHVLNLKCMIIIIVIIIIIIIAIIVLATCYVCIHAAKFRMKRNIQYEWNKHEQRSFSSSNCTHLCLSSITFSMLVHLYIAQLVISLLAWEHVMGVVSQLIHFHHTKAQDTSKQPTNRLPKRFALVKRQSLKIHGNNNKDDTYIHARAWERMNREHRPSKCLRGCLILYGKCYVIIFYEVDLCLFCVWAYARIAYTSVFALRLEKIRILQTVLCCVLSLFRSI